MKRAMASMQPQKQWIREEEDGSVYSRKPEAGKEETNCDWRKTYADQAFQGHGHLNFSQ
jgi:hypothetical protein